MISLYHNILCPFSRKVRILLAAKGVKFESILASSLNGDEKFAALNPLGLIPMLVCDDVAVYDSHPIVEYIEERWSDKESLLGASLKERSEARKMQSWFDGKFYNDVTKYVLKERYYRSGLAGKSSYPNPDVIRIAKSNIAQHFILMSEIIDRDRYLASNKISVADFSAAAHISVLDYFGDIDWNRYPTIKHWYSIIKSHKVFGEVLKDRIPNLPPPLWYSKIDF